MHPPASKSNALFRVGASVVALGLSVAVVQNVSNESSEGNESLAIPVRDHLRSTFSHVLSGLGVTAGMAYGLYSTNVATRIAVWALRSPFIHLGVGVSALMTTMMIARTVDPGVGKYVAHSAFYGTMAAVISPIALVYHPALMIRAGLYTLGLTGGLSLVALTAEREKYLWMAGPLIGALGAVCASSLLQLVLVRSVATAGASKLSMTAYSVADCISLYGGLAVFTGLFLVDTQMLINRTEELVNDGKTLPSPLDDSLHIYLDTVNVFIRLVEILARASKKKH